MTTSADEQEPRVKSVDVTPTRTDDTVRRFVIDYVPAAILIVMVVHVVINAIARSVFASPVDNTLEIAQYWYLPALTSIGFVSAALRNEHIRANLLYDRLPRVPKAIADRGGSALCAIVCLLFCIYGAAEAYEAWHVRMTAGSSTLIVWPVYLLIPLSFAALTIIYARNAVAGSDDSDHVAVVVPEDEQTESPR